MLITISVAYMALAVTTIIFLQKGNNKLYVPTKALTSALFLVLGFYGYSVTGNGLYFTLLGGYVLCFLGDVLLALAHEIDNNLVNPYFNLGVTAFGIAHIVYCVAFGNMLEWKVSPYWGIALVLAAITFITTQSKKYDYKGKKVQSVCYALLVGLMCGMGLDVFLTSAGGNASYFIGLGAVLFMASDSALANKYYLIKKQDFLGTLVLVAYYGAMFLLSLIPLCY